MRCAVAATSAAVTRRPRRMVSARAARRSASPALLWASFDADGTGGRAWFQGPGGYFRKTEGGALRQA